MDGIVINITIIVLIVIAIAIVVPIIVVIRKKALIINILAHLALINPGLKGHNLPGD